MGATPGDCVEVEGGIDDDGALGTSAAGGAGAIAGAGIAAPDRIFDLEAWACRPDTVPAARALACLAGGLEVCLVDALLTALVGVLLTGLVEAFLAGLSADLASD